MNHFTCIGYFARDPETRTVPTSQGDITVVNFTLGVNGNRGQKDKEDSAAFLDFEAWAQGAELIAKFFHKGDPIIIADAEARQDRWTDNDGQKRSRIRFRVNRFEFVPRNERRAPTPNGEAEAPDAGTRDGQEAPDTGEKPAEAPEKTPRRPAGRQPGRPSRARQAVPVDGEDDDIPF